MKQRNLRLDIRIALIYAIIGVLWILLSDRLLAALIIEVSTLNAWQTYKGWAFVAVSALAIFLLLRHELELRNITEGRLMESEERYRLLFQNSMDAIVISAPDGSIYEANPAACGLFRRTEEEIRQVGRNGLIDVTDPRLREALEERANTGRFHGVLTFIRKDGSRFEGELTSSLFRTQDVVARSGMIIRDITERRQAEEALRKSEQTFSVIFKKAPFSAGLASHSDGAYLEVNEEFERVFGISRQEIVGKTSFELGIHPDAQMWERSAVMFREQGSVHNLDMRLQTRNDEVHDFLVNSDVVEIGGEKYILTTANDITERKRVEKALLESEERYRTLVEISPNAIFIYRDNRITFINQSGLKLLGATQLEQILGRSAFEILHPDHRPAIQEQIEAMLRDNKPMEQIEEQIVGLDGATRDVVVNATPFEEHGVTVIQVIMRNITERKRAEKSLRETQTFLSSLLEVAPASIYVMSLDDQFILVNSQWEKDTQIDRSDVLGNSIDEIFSHPLAQKYKKDNRQVAQTGTMLITEEWADTPTGNRCFFTVKFPLNNSAGHVEKIGGISFDVTERKEMEEELRTGRNRLSQLSRQLVQAHEKERRAIGRELHDQIGQMLTAMQITLDLAQQLPANEAAKKLAQAHELTGELLQRISRISLELRPSMLDDLGLLSALLWHINKYQEQTGIQVDFRHSGIEDRRFVPEIETTAYRIVQEALTNVARHAHARRVRLEVRTGAGQLEIRIEDDGKGFDPQAALAQNRGLSGMRERAQLIGGTFQITSDPGEGTRKLIQLPLPEDMP